MFFLNSVLVFAVTLIINFFTLYLVASKTKKGRQTLLTSKAFLIGDFFLIPLYFVILFDYAINLSPVNLSNNVLSLATFFSGLIILSMGIKFKLLNLLWLPHGIFAWFIVFSFLLTTYTALFIGIGNSVLWVALFLLLLLHQFGASRLGSKYLPLK